jgi:hypothetical protein
MPNGRKAREREMAAELLSPQQVRQLGEVDRHPPRFVLGEHIGRRPDSSSK